MAFTRDTLGGLHILVNCAAGNFLALPEGATAALDVLFAYAHALAHSLSASSQTCPPTGSRR